jgi:hypothetical protein
VGRRTRAARYFDVVSGLDGSRRFAWAKYYDAEQRAQAERDLALALRERVEDLIPHHLALISAVLTKRNCVAFALALSEQQLILEFLDGLPEDDARRRRDYDA